MKKYLALMGAAILIMALAMPAAAQMLTKSWGFIEIYHGYERNPDFKTGSGVYRQGTGYSFGAANQDITYKFLYERFRLFLQHGDAKTVMGVIGFEADSTDWGEGSPTSLTGGKFGRYTIDTVQMEIKWAYMHFVIPNTPVTVRLGAQDFNYGGRLYVNNDAMGGKVRASFAPHQIEAAWWRENDNSRTGTEIRENYALEYKLTQKDFNAYAWGAYTNQNLGFVQDHPYWLGVGGGFKPGNFNFSGQFVYVAGNREDRASTLVTKDYGAFAAEVLGYYQIGPGLKAGAEFFYATGNDANNQNTKINMYPTATSSEAKSIFGNDRTVFFWMASSIFGNQFNKENDFGGYWYGRLTAEYSPVKWMNLIFNYLYIQDTSTGNPNGTRVVNSPENGAQQWKDSSDVGQEINVIAKINIQKGLGWNLGLAYFIPGSVFDRYNTAGTAVIKTPDPAWALNGRLRYDF